VRASRKDAATLKQKVASINAHAERPTKAGQRIMVTENEVNSYLVFEAPVAVADRCRRSVSERSSGPAV
jgi:hypothetical protein